jgi:hypothetical protein
MLNFWAKVGKIAVKLGNVFFFANLADLLLEILALLNMFVRLRGSKNGGAGGVVT